MFHLSKLKNNYNDKKSCDITKRRNHVTALYKQFQIKFELLKAIMARNIGIIFCTAERRLIGDHMYDYRDLILENRFDRSEMYIIWKGQRKGREDHIVTSGDVEVHLFAREYGEGPFSYLGVLVHESMVLEHLGNHALGDPFAYRFQILTDGPTLLLPCNTVCERDAALDEVRHGVASYQRAAARHAGITMVTAMKGIYRGTV
jgi:hypothetical protein